MTEKREEEKHVPMQHQADYNPPLEQTEYNYRFSGGAIKPKSMPIMCEGPGPEILYINGIPVPIVLDERVPPGQIYIMERQNPERK